MYIVDPHGVPRIEPKNTAGIDVAPEEVALVTYDEDKFGAWAAFHFTAEYAQGTATGTQRNESVHAEKHNLEIRIDKSGMLQGTATTTLVAQSNGVRVVPFNLYRTLRVQRVTVAGGESLDFIQEDKNEDAEFAVILPKSLAAGERFTVRTAYGGKDVVTNQGGGNYYPIARESWYPNTRFGDYANYEMRFHIPKGMKIVATGKLAREIDEGNENVSDWNSEAPQAVAGFNIGRFKVQEAKLEKDGFVVESCANLDEPDIIKQIRGTRVETTYDPLTGARESRVVSGGMPTVTTTGLMQKALAEGQVAFQVYSDYFGLLPYHRLAITQQTALGYGQSWPELVFLPITYYFDTTIRHGVGLDDPRGYFSTVGPHEVAHQWWGHAVGFHSYRDQWMSEGFADFSASLFLQATRPDMKDYHKFWNDQRELLLEKNRFGYRAIDAGPLTLGYRLSNTKTGWEVARRLIYPKGSYVLHMLRMMMWSQQTGDAQFKDMLKDFLKTYSNQAASTEDFKAIVEKHMLPEMNLTGDGRMDWFFDEYVYGTALPEYTFGYTFSNDAAGRIIINVSLQQSNVDDHFRMRVPIYLELANGKVVRMTSANIFGNKKLEQAVPLSGLKDRPKRAMLNYYHDVLCTERK